MSKADYDEIIKALKGGGGGEGIRDTGWRNIKALVPNTVGGLLFNRTHNTITLAFSSLVLSPVPTSRSLAITIPGTNAIRDLNVPLGATGGSAVLHTFTCSTNGTHTIWMGTGSDSFSGLVVFPTSSPWPTTLPGVAI